MKKNTTLTCLLVTLALFLFAPSCTNDNNNSTEDEPITVRSRLRADPGKLNPLLTTKSYALQITDIIFPTLLRFDPTTGELSPVLAKSRPSVEPITEGPYKGGAAYTYEILEEAQWDNGQPVLASDYLFTLKALFNPEVRADVYRGVLGFIKNLDIDPDNPKKFTVYTDQLFRSEASTGLFVYPEHAYDSTGLMRQVELTDLTDPARRESLKENAAIAEFAKKFNSTGSPDEVTESCGAYRVVEWETGQRIVLEKKENWWGDKLVDQYPLLAANPKEIIYKVIPDHVAAITAMKDDQLDVTGKIPSSLFKEFRASDAAGKFNFHTPEQMAFMYLGLNTRRPHLNDKRVRRALAHLTDVNEIIQTVQQGLAVPTVGPFPPKAAYFNKDLQPIPFDIDKAKALLAEAGWQDSDNDGVLDKLINGKKTPLELTFTITPNNEVSGNITTIVKEDARKAGVVINAAPTPPNKLFENLGTRDFDAYMLASGFDLDLYDPGQFWHTSSDTPSGSNRVGFGNSETDAMIDEIRNTNDEGRRTELYGKLQEIIYDEQPFIFLYAPQDRIVISKKFKNATTTLVSPGYMENHFR